MLFTLISSHIFKKIIQNLQTIHGNIKKTTQSWALIQQMLTTHTLERQSFFLSKSCADLLDTVFPIFPKDFTTQEQ